MQQIFYNSVALHDLGRVIITRQASRGEPEQAPQRWRRRIQLRINFHQPDYASNLALVRQVESVVRVQHAVLRWVDTGSGAEWVSHPADLVEHDWPETPNAFGTYHQSLTLAFEFIEDLHAVEHRSMAATFQRSGPGRPVIDLGIVESFKVERNTQRYDAHRDHRSDVTGRLSARGRIKGDPNLALEDRRAAMLAAMDQFVAEIGEGNTGRITYGTTNQVVRISACVAEIDQAKWDIPWSLTAEFSAFPNEAGYAQADFTVATREDPAANELHRTFSGRIAADSEVAAVSKLESVRNGVLSGAAWAVVRREQSAEKVDGEDGSTFIRLSFAEEYRRSVDAIVESALDISDADDADSGLIRRSYSGRVTASASSYEDAYEVAVARARALGHRKFQFQTLADEGAEDPRLGSGADKVGVTGSVLVTVRFRYEYRIKGTRLRVSLSTRTAREMFGSDVEAVNGSIVAVDAAAASQAYDVIRAQFSSRLIRDETKTFAEEQIGELQNNVPTGAMATIFSRLEFSFSMHAPKTGGTFAARYDLDVTQDFVNRTKTTVVRGVALGSTQAAIESWLAAFFVDAGFGTPTSSRRTQSLERGTNDDKDDVENLLSVSFDQTYVAALSGASAILSCELSEQIDCSGNRVVPQPTAAGVDVIQVLPSIASGRRSISGTVVATDETTALAWAKRQRSLPMSAAFGSSGIRAYLPPRISFAPEWVPMVDGVARSGDYDDGGGARTINVKLVRCRFEFSEVFEQLEIV